MIYHLRFPHNIERLVFDHALEMQDQHDIYQAVKKSNEIELAVAQWFDNQQRPMQILAAALTLFPDNSTSDIQDFYFHVCRELKVTDDGLLKLAKRSAGYIRLNVRADLAYPSYTEGIMETLWNVDLHLAWELIRLRAEHVSGNNLTALIQCRRAIQLLNRNERISVASPMSHSLADEDYFTRFVCYL